jgi:hypothetical protein
MKQEILNWRNIETGNIRTEVRQQINANLWQSLTDGRYYTKGIIGWYDVTENYKSYL